MSERARTLAAHARALGDDDLNDLLVELPPARFAGLCQLALARPWAPDALALSFHRAAPRTSEGEVTRWEVRAWHRGHRGDRGMVRGVLGAVARLAWPGDRGGEAGGWVAYTRPGATGEQPVQAGAWWPTRGQAAAALAWQSPASGARCLALAAYVRALGDDDLGDLLVELPPGRFAALLRAAVGAPVGAGEAA